jgi:hypothetical protein
MKNLHDQTGQMAKFGRGKNMIARNGWTKASMIEHVKKNFKGKSTGLYKTHGSGTLTTGCVYRGPEDRKCGVGLFIEDRHYVPSMEGCSLYSLLNLFPEVKSTMPLDEYGMTTLQQIHDNTADLVSTEKLVNWIETNVED